MYAPVKFVLDKSPVAKNIALIPREFDGTIDGLSKPQIFNLEQLSSNIYQLTEFTNCFQR